MKTILTIILSIITVNIHAMEIPQNKRIDYWVKEYSVNRRPHFKASLLRSSLYLKTAKRIFNEKGIPEDLAWLPFVESGFNCASKSTAKAAGCWQFIPRTGKAYGLKKGAWKDQRYDFNRSTVAAALFLKELHKKFRDWELVLAAYNSGGKAVRSAIKKSGNRDYWKLELPRETMNYIPKFYAVLKITRNLKKYGYKNGSKKLIVVKLKKGMHSLPYIAKILRVDYREFKQLNPGFEVGYTPPGKETEIYLKRDWNIAFLRGFGYLEEKRR